MGDDTNVDEMVLQLYNASTADRQGKEQSTLNIFGLADFRRSVSLHDSKSKSRSHTYPVDPILNDGNKLAYDTRNNCVPTSLKVRYHYFVTNEIPYTIYIYMGVNMYICIYCISAVIYDVCT